MSAGDHHRLALAGAALIGGLMVTAWIAGLRERVDVSSACFLAAAGLAIALARYPIARRAWLALFLAVVLDAGLRGWSGWPFFNWHLYGWRAVPAHVYHDLRVADAAGREIKLDARAAPPTLATPLRRYGGRFETRWSEAEQEAMAAFLIEKADAYRDRVLSGRAPLADRLRFPRHQYGYRWTAEALDGIGPFTELRVYRVRLELSGDGTDFVSLEDTRVATFSR